MKSTTKQRPCKKLHVHRETLRMLSGEELKEVAAAAPTFSPRCTFSEPSLCPTCLCTA